MTLIEFTVYWMGAGLCLQILDTYLASDRKTLVSFCKAFLAMGFPSHFIAMCMPLYPVVSILGNLLGLGRTIYSLVLTQLLSLCLPLLVLMVALHAVG